MISKISISSKVISHTLEQAPLFTKTNSVIDATQYIAKRIFNDISKSKIAKFCSQYQPIKIFFYTKKLFKNVYKISEYFSRKIKTVGETAKTFCRSQKILNKALDSTYFSPLLTLPFAIYKIVKCAMKIFKHNTLMQKVDAGIGLTTTLSELTEGAVYIAKGLEKFGAVTLGAIKWTTGVTIASVVLSSAVIFTHIRNWYKTHSFLKNADQQLHEKNDDYKKAVDSLVQEKKSGSYLNASKKQLESIKDYSENVADSSQLETLYAKLRSRIKTKIFSHKLALVSAVVSLIATVILLATPLAPLAYAVMAVGALILIGKYIQERFNQSRFDHWVTGLKTEILAPKSDTPPRRKTKNRLKQARLKQARRENARRENTSLGNFWLEKDEKERLRLLQKIISLQANSSCISDEISKKFLAAGVNRAGKVTKTNGVVAAA